MVRARGNPVTYGSLIVVSDCRLRCCRRSTGRGSSRLPEKPGFSPPALQKTRSLVVGWNPGRPRVPAEGGDRRLVAEGGAIVTWDGPVSERRLPGAVIPGRRSLYSAPGGVRDNGER
jgi:hypothetical protein